MNRYTKFPLPIYTSRLQLRAPVMASSDARVYYESVLNSMPEISRWLGWAVGPYTMTRAEDYVRVSAYNWLERSNTDIGLAFWIMDRSGQEFIGNIVIWNINWYVPKFEFGFWLDSSKTGQGYMQEAVVALARYCLTLGVARIEIKCEVANQRIHNMMRRINFHLDGVLPSATRAVNGGQLTDVALYSCVDIDVLPEIEVKW